MTRRYYWIYIQTNPEKNEYIYFTEEKTQARAEKFAERYWQEHNKGALVIYQGACVYSIGEPTN